MTQETAVALLRDRGWDHVTVTYPGRRFYRVTGTFAGQSYSAVRGSLDDLIGDFHRAALEPPPQIIERVVDRVVEVPVDRVVEVERIIEVAAPPLPPSPSPWLQSKMAENERTEAAKRRLLQRYTALEQKVEYRSASNAEYIEHAELFDNLLELRAR
jgi:hypothetical protein